MPARGGGFPISSAVVIDARAERLITFIDLVELIKLSGCDRDGSLSMYYFCARHHSLLMQGIQKAGIAKNKTHRTRNYETHVEANQISLYFIGCASRW